MTVAIVSTQRTWKPESEPWAHYHLSLGFSRIYVFVDDGRTDYTPASSAVRLVACSKEYWEAHSPNRYLHYLDDVRRDWGAPTFGSPQSLIQRQVLNANAGVALAAADGIDWVLHIDDDEYFWCPDTSADAHFYALQRSGIHNVRYFNHEAVLLGPETPAEKKRRTCFKKNWSGLQGHQRRDIPRVTGGKPYFTCYSNGKSAARTLPNIMVANGPHSFWFDDPMAMGASAEFNRPAVLHRPFKDVSQFCRKYLQQGTFAIDTLLGEPWSPPGIQAQAQRLAREGDMDGLRALYEQLATVSEAERAMMENEGYLLFLDKPMPFDEKEKAVSRDLVTA
jgi:hypothetical protein